MVCAGKPVSVRTLYARCAADGAATEQRVRAERDAALEAAVQRTAAMQQRVEAERRAKLRREAKARAAAKAAEQAAREAEEARLAQAARARQVAVKEAVGAAAAKRTWDRRDVNATGWVRFGGASLEAALSVSKPLGEAPVRLVDARYLVELARGGGVLPRRGELPDDAFLSLEAVRTMVDTGFHSLRVAAVSWAWLQFDEPDPRGDQLRQLGEALDLLVRDETFAFEGTYAVFIDWASLPQCARGADARTERDEALYRLALESVHHFYAHPATVVLSLSAFPRDFPGCYPVDYASGKRVAPEERCGRRRAGGHRRQSPIHREARPAP